MSLSISSERLSPDLMMREGLALPRPMLMLTVAMTSSITIFYNSKEKILDSFDQRLLLDDLKEIKNVCTNSCKIADIFNR